jgi:Fe-S-cluster containining protein
MNVISQSKFRREDLKKGECLCDHCPAKCCRYFSLAIDEPTSFADFEFIRWYLLHESATVFVEGTSWYLLVHTVCKHLQSDNRCGIYETRPQICRDYSTDSCEFNDDWTFDQYFETAEQIEEYANARFNTPETFRSRKPTGLPILAS